MRAGVERGTASLVSTEKCVNMGIGTPGITYVLMCARWSHRIAYGGCTRCVRSAIWLDMVPEGTNMAASLPVNLAMCASSASVEGSW